MQVPRLEELRTKAFLTQDSLAARSGVSRDTISKLETGERVNAHARTVAKLAKALNVEPWELQGRAPQPEDFPVTVGRKERSGKLSLGGGVSGRSRLRKVELRITESELASVMYAYRHAMEELLPENTPPEVYMTMEWLALVVHGWGYEEAKARANERAYGSSRDLREDDFDA